MKFTVVSHACLYIEHDDIRLLLDPWIVGSVIGGWWNYPEVPQDLIKNFKPNSYILHIYIGILSWPNFKKV